MSGLTSDVLTGSWAVDEEHRECRKEYSDSNDLCNQTGDNLIRSRRVSNLAVSIGSITPAVEQNVSGSVRWATSSMRAPDHRQSGVIRVIDLVSDLVHSGLPDWEVFRTFRATGLVNCISAMHIRFDVPPCLASRLALAIADEHTHQFWKGPSSLTKPTSSRIVQGGFPIMKILDLNDRVETSVDEADVSISKSHSNWSLHYNSRFSFQHLRNLASFKATPIKVHEAYFMMPFLYPIPA
ncbi:hypothetical protein BO79DRAFT_259584 [Aspergillus costaricaensis CBS 115574]|uniref:Uncharacterized protein n=1 Tax=Aspergillus costaricaensis CBS 115574 TaxID=1448317 RepID=A0ACD1I120_9EURO|nr:hypothetical protein BO79DRAFT_259584 [Aspergillus costaricaensis CBS 115574]RAK84161.1 hypothetical protein BO79DRAFT_259584 [Aspergillus costaricaensis CBS 115574]